MSSLKVSLTHLLSLPSQTVRQSLSDCSSGVIMTATVTMQLTMPKKRCHVAVVFLALMFATVVGGEGLRDHPIVGDRCV